jgi:nicotinamidase-related amidase
MVVAGISSSGGVEGTARQAYELGYHATLVVDAMMDREMRDHDFAVGRVRDALGPVYSTGTL